MAKKSLTADDLIRTIKRKAFIPQDDDTYTDTDLLEMMNNESDVFLVPELLSRNEEYLVYTHTVDIDADTYEYEIPYRAVGNKLRDIFFISNPDEAINKQSMRELHYVDPSEIYAYQGSFTYTSSYTVGLNYTVKNNKIIILNDLPSSNGALRMDFYMQPSELVLEQDAGKILAIDRTNGILTLSNFPTEFSNLPSEGADFVKFRSPNSILDFDVSITSVSSSAKTITLAAADIPTDLIVGDYICFPQETPIPNVPSELHSVLAQQVVISILEGLDDEQAKQSAERQLAKMTKSLDTVFSDRVEGSSKKIINRHSPLMQGRGTATGRGFNNN